MDEHVEGEVLGTVDDASTGRNAAADKSELRRAKIVEGERPWIQNKQLSVPTQFNDPISVTQSASKNRAIIRVEAYREANEIWELGKVIDLVTKQTDEEIIQALVDMEERDMLQCNQVQEANLGTVVQTVS